MARRRCALPAGATARKYVGVLRIIALRQRVPFVLCGINRALSLVSGYSVGCD